MASAAALAFSAGYASNSNGPSDNKGNSYVQLGSAHAYVPAWPNSGTALYAAQSANGGSGQVVTAGNANNPSDEVTVAVVEVKNGTSVNQVWNEVQGGNALTSASITTTGPATQ